MSENICPITHQPMPDGYAIHPACSGKLIAASTSIPELMSCLDDALAKRLHTGKSSTHSGNPCPLNLGILDKAYVERARLLTALGLLAETLNQPHPETWGDTANQLHDNAHTICRLTQTGPTDSNNIKWPTLAEYIYKQTMWSINQITRMIDRAPERKYIGPCPHCGKDLYARHTITNCYYCHTPVDPEEIRATMLNQLWEIRFTNHVDLSKALNLLGHQITESTLKRMRRKGLIQYPVTPLQVTHNLPRFDKTLT